jgi:hypothetical protein
MAPTPLRNDWEITPGDASKILLDDLGEINAKECRRFAEGIGVT